MSNLSIRCCSLNKNKLCPSISLVANESACSMYPCIFRNTVTSSASQSDGFLSNVPSSVLCPGGFLFVDLRERLGRKSLES